MKKIIFVLLAFLVVAIIAYHAFPEKVAGLMIDLAACNSGLTKKQIQIDDHTIVYFEGGNGPSILLLHGYAADKNSWLLLAYYLNKKYHLLIPDIPGYGESSQLTYISYNLNSQIERLHKFVQAVNMQQFHIAGSSMGGFFAGAYAARYPDEILSLGLFNAGGVMPVQMSDVFKMMEKGENPLLLKDENDFDRLMGLIFYKMPLVPYPIKYSYITKALANRSFNEKTLKDITPDFFSLEQALPNIKAPTLILWSEKDRVLDISSVPLFEKGIRNHKTMIFKDCGHAPMIEKPKETAAAYSTFIQDITVKNSNP